MAGEENERENRHHETNARCLFEWRVIVTVNEPLDGFTFNFKTNKKWYKTSHTSANDANEQKQIQANRKSEKRKMAFWNICDSFTVERMTAAADDTIRSLFFRIVSLRWSVSRSFSKNAQRTLIHSLTKVLNYFLDVVVVAVAVITTTLRLIK